jgi:uncharacterized membrane protein YccC
MLANAAQAVRSASLADIHFHKLAGGAGLAIRAALGATIAYVIATALGSQHPIYALVAAIIGTEYVSKETTRIGFQQLVATSFGAISGTLIRTIFPPSAASAGLGILISVLACYVTIRDGRKSRKDRRICDRDHHLGRGGEAIRPRPISVHRDRPWNRSRMAAEPRAAADTDRDEGMIAAID